MGGSESKPELTQEQRDIRHLAERFAFGDDELRHLYRAYHRVASALTSSSSQQWQGKSFVQDWGWACYNSNNIQAPAASRTTSATAPKTSSSRPDEFTSQTPPISESTNNDFLEQNQAKNRLERLQRADELLGSFGNRLYAQVFLASGDVSVYTNVAGQSGAENSTGTRSNNPLVVDEYTRMSRLEAIFEGLAQCSRRGSQAALTALFQTLQNDQHQVSAIELVTLGYHLAMVTALLQGQTDFILPSHPESLQAFAQSLQDRATSHRQRYGIAVEPTTAENDLIELTELLEWADISCPVFASILPSFLWQVFFPNRPSPPSRTAFELPQLVVLASNKPITSSKNNPKRSSSSTTSISEEEEEPTDTLSPQQEAQEGGDGDGVDDSANNSASETDQYAEAVQRLLSPTERFVLACCSSSLNGPYVPLFNSEQDGLSFNRLLNALLGYDGPTLLVLRTGPCTLGAYTASKWKECRDFYGTSETFLFSLAPQIRVYRPTLRQDNPNYQYCNSSARSKGYDQQAHGLGFGGNAQRLRLFISESLDDCYADKQDLTFDNGPLLTVSTTDPKSGDTMSSFGKGATITFSPDSLQVWAVGGEEVVQAALMARGQHRQVVEQGLRRARKVDRAQFLDDFRSGAIDSKAFAYRQQIDGRADADVKERHYQQMRQQQQPW